MMITFGKYKSAKSKLQKFSKGTLQKYRKQTNRSQIIKSKFHNSIKLLTSIKLQSNNFKKLIGFDKTCFINLKENTKYFRTKQKTSKIKY
jgi:hypothetical protein